MRMWTFAVLAACLCLWATDRIAAGQRSEARVAVVREGQRDLERTAYRLRISVERLQRARLALQEATQILQEAELDQIQEGRRIPQLWLWLDRRQAMQRLEAMLARRSRQAARLESAADYQKLLRWAVEVASRMAELDPSRALQLVQSWPAPAEWLGDSAAELFDKLQAGLASESFSRRFSENARQAIYYLLHSDQSTSRFHSDLSRIRRTQDREEANRLVDEILSYIRQADPSGQLQGWTTLARRAANLPHDRHSELLEGALLAAVGSDADSAGEQTFLFEGAGKEVALSAREYRIVQVLRSFANQPEALIKALEEWPEVKEAVARLGGLDRSLRARPAAVQRPGQEKPYDYRANRQSRAEAFELYQELKANTISRPWWVRQRLDAIGHGSEEGFAQLTRLLARALNEFPELAELALNQMELLVGDEEDPALRLKRFSRFADYYRRLEGNLTPELVQEGFRLLDAAQEALQDEEAAASGSATPQILRIEAFLLAEWAVIDFESAMNEVRRQESPARQLQILAAVIRRLGGNQSRLRL